MLDHTALEMAESTPQRANRVVFSLFHCLFCLSVDGGYDDE